MSITEVTAEPTRPAKPAALRAATLCEAFQTTAAERSDQVALRAFGSDVTLTWAQYAARVRTIAAGLHALGVRHGDTVALMLTNRPEFCLVDTAAMHLGAVPFSVYNSFSPEQIAELLTNAESTVVVTEEQFLGVIARARESAPVVRHVFTAEALAELEAHGGDDFDLEAAWRVFFND